jgi:hypothetical protein
MHAVAEAREVDMCSPTKSTEAVYYIREKGSQGVHSVNLKWTKKVATIHTVAFV